MQSLTLWSGYHTFKVSRTAYSIIFLYGSIITKVAVTTVINFCDLLLIFMTTINVCQNFLFYYKIYNHQNYIQLKNHPCFRGTTLNALRNYIIQINEFRNIYT